MTVTWIRNIAIAFGVGIPYLAYAEQTVGSGDTANPIAFVNVHVVPMDEEHVLENQTVIVEGTAIVALGPASTVSVPGDALRIDGTGKFLMPGLADMHVHLREEYIPLLLANGVTTVRNLFGLPKHLDMRERVKTGELLGPTVYTAGPIIDGPPPLWGEEGVVATTAREAAEAVADHYALGYDFIKPYGNLSPDAYWGLIGAAKSLDIPVAGHAPESIRLTDVLRSGQIAIEHLTGYWWEELAHDQFQADLRWRNVPPQQKRETMRAVGRHLASGELTIPGILDEDKLSAIATATRESGVWHVPTLVVMQGGTLSTADRREVLDSPSFSYLPEDVRRFWESRDQMQVDTEEMAPWHDWRLEVLRALHRAGVPILLGTDFPNPFVVPGYAIHQELRNLVAAGLTPYEALLAGTGSAAEFIGSPGEFGTVQIGARADLILLNRNPLTDVAHVQNPIGVMVDGKWLPAAALLRMQENLIN